MILGLTKTMHTRIVGQRQVRGKAQSKRADGFTYSFMTNLTRADLDWSEIEDVCNQCFSDIFRIPQEATTKDIEISLDIPSKKYSLRFNSSQELSENAYGANVKWSIQSLAGDEYYISDSKPIEYINNSRYSIEIELEALTLDEIEEIERGDYND